MFNMKRIVRIIFIVKIIQQIFIIFIEKTICKN